MSSTRHASETPEQKLARLDDARPRAHLRNAVVLGLFGIFVAALTLGGLHPLALFGEQRLANASNFAAKLVPRPFREGAEFSLSAYADWLAGIWTGGAGQATWTTLQIAVLATFMAAAIALLLSPAADRRLASADPYLDPRPTGWRRALAGAMRLAFVLARAIPEYLLAFLALALLGRGAWPAVLALALHNAGILARLETEVLENLAARPLSGLRQLGGTRRQIAHLAAQPLAAGRFAAFASYRLETCLRETVALGLLGTLSLGYVLGEARARRAYDEFVVVLGIGAVLVVLTDALARRVRARLRRT